MARATVQSENGEGRGTDANVPAAEARLGGSERASGDSGGIGNMAGTGSADGTGIDAHGRLQSDPGVVPGTDLEGLFSGGLIAPQHDNEASRRWPTIQLCMRAVVTRDGKPRAGGEVKTIAQGACYLTTLTMPEEGRLLRVNHNTLSDAWDALESRLNTRPVPWEVCSDFAKRRAKIKQKKEDPKLLDRSEKGR